MLAAPPVVADHHQRPLARQLAGAARELAERNRAANRRSGSTRTPTARARRRAAVPRATRPRASARARRGRAAGSKLETRRRRGVLQRVDHGLEQDRASRARPARPSARAAPSSPARRRRPRTRALRASAARGTRRAAPASSRSARSRRRSRGPSRARHRPTASSTDPMPARASFAFASAASRGSISTLVTCAPRLASSAVR